MFPTTVASVKGGGGGGPTVAAFTTLVGTDSGGSIFGFWSQNPSYFVSGDPSLGSEILAAVSIPGVILPAGHSVVSAVLRLQVLDAVPTPATRAGEIYAQEGVSPPAIDGGNLPAVWTATSARTSIPAGSLATVGIKDYDVTALVQEVITDGGWVSGGRMNFAMPMLGAVVFGEYFQFTTGGDPVGAGRLTLTTAPP
jgi:hypothetical protein